MIERTASYEDGPIRLHEVAKRQEISVCYLERMMQSMINAGLMYSMRGQNGGFVLSKAPDKIYLSRIFATAGGSLSLVDCVENSEVCRRHSLCVSRDVWKEVKNAMVSVLDSISLQNLIEKRRKKSTSF